VRVLRTIKGARVSIVPGMKIILVFRLVASVGKHVFRKRNAYLCIDLVSYKTVWRWYTGLTGELENSDVRIRISSHQSKPVSNLFTSTGWAGKAFIRCRRCLLPKTKGISNSDLKRWALFGLVDKVGIYN